MKKIMLAVMILVLCSFGCSERKSSGGISDGNIKLTGRVADSETGNGLYAKVTITAGADTREVYTTTELKEGETLQDVGWFVFNNVPNGRIKIQIEVEKDPSEKDESTEKVVQVNTAKKSADYYGIWEASVSLTYSESAIYEVTDRYLFTGSQYDYIAMRPGYTAKIQVVTSPMREPVSGAKVFLSGYDSQVVRSGVTDGTGLVSFAKLMKHGRSYGTSSWINDYYVSIYPIDIDGDGCFDYVASAGSPYIYGDVDSINKIVTMLPVDDLSGAPENFSLAGTIYSNYNFLIAESPLMFTTSYPVTPRLGEYTKCNKCIGGDVKTALTMCNNLDTTDITLEAESVFAGMGVKVTPSANFEKGSTYMCQNLKEAQQVGYFLYGTIDSSCPAGYKDVTFANSFSFTAVEDSTSAFTAKKDEDCVKYKDSNGNALSETPCIVGPITSLYVNGEKTGTAIDTNDDGVLDSLYISCVSGTSGISYNIASRSLIDNRVLWEGNVACIDVEPEEAE